MDVFAPLSSTKQEFTAISTVHAYQSDQRAWSAALEEACSARPISYVSAKKTGGQNGDSVTRVQKPKVTSKASKSRCKQWRTSAGGFDLQVAARGLAADLVVLRGLAGAGVETNRH